MLKCKGMFFNYLTKQVGYQWKKSIVKLFSSPEKQCNGWRWTPIKTELIKIKYVNRCKSWSPGGHQSWRRSLCAGFYSIWRAARRCMEGGGGREQLAHPRVLSSSNQNQGCDFLLWIRRSTEHHHKSQSDLSVRVIRRIEGESSWEPIYISLAFIYYMGTRSYSSSFATVNNN